MRTFLLILIMLGCVYGFFTHGIYHPREPLMPIYFFAMLFCFMNIFIGFGYK